MMREIDHWEPQPGPQSALIGCPIEDVFFGGARGGGKTDGLLGDWLNYADEYGDAARGVIFRRTYPELEEIERRSREIFAPIGAEWKASKRVWEWSSGAQLKLRYLQREDDADRYQGHSYSYIGWDEATNWSTPRSIDKMRACLRSPQGAPCLVRLTGNPGGPGHNWVKARYVDPAPPMQPFFDSEARVWRVYIPSRIEDNIALAHNDPDYWQRVEAAASGREDLLKAWRYGQWDIVAGGMFDDVWKPTTHILAPFAIPARWRIDRSFDWGSSKPFVVQWWAESNGDAARDGRAYPPGTLFHIAELYGWTGRPNEGVRMSATEIARRIVDFERAAGWAVVPGPADPSIFATENASSIAADMERLGVRWERPSTTARVQGWERMRRMMRASLSKPIEEPALFVFDTCRQFIRTVPVLSRSDRDQDDVDTSAEDHAADAARYRIMAVKNEIRVVRLSGV